MTLPTFEDVDVSTVVLTVDALETDTVDETAELETDDTLEVEEQETEETEQKSEVDPVAQATYDSLVERGILTRDENFDGTFEGIENQFTQLPSQLLRSAIDELPQHSQGVLKYIATAGQNLNPDELKQYMREYLNEQELSDVTTADSARTFLEEHLKSQGLRPNAIQAQLDDLEDSNELISEAEKLLSNKEKKTDKLIQDKEVDNQRIVDEQKQFVQNINQTLTDLKWSKVQQQTVLSTIPKTNQILQTAVKDPKAYIQLVDFLSKFNGKEFDLEDYKKQGEARSNSSLRDKITKSGFSSASSKTGSSSASPDKDIFKNYKPIV